MLSWLFDLLGNAVVVWCRVTCLDVNGGGGGEREKEKDAVKVNEVSVKINEVSVKMNEASVQGHF